MSDRIFNIIHVFLGSLVISCLYACSSKVDSNSQAQSNNLSQSTIESASAAKERKPGANIHLVSQSTLSGTLNQLSEHRLSFNLPRNKIWQVQLSCDSGIELLSATQMQTTVPSVGSITEASTFDIPVKWLPKVSGRHYLHVHFSHQSEESAEARDIGLILDISDSTNSTSQTLAQKVEIEKKSQFSSSAVSGIIELPADETIKVKK